jgi:hypothetical protein
VDKDQPITVDIGTAPTGISVEGEEHNSVVSLRFSITECVNGS